MTTARWAGAASLILCLTPLAFGNGGRSKKILYEAKVAYASDICRFSAEVEPTLFRLTSAGNRFKVIQIKINNRSKEPLALSNARDRLRVQFDNGEVQGILDLSSVDAAVWDALDRDLREELAYPSSVPPGEERNVYLFMDNPALKSMPRGIRYRVASLPNEVQLRDTSAARAAFRPGMTAFRRSLR